MIGQYFLICIAIRFLLDRIRFGWLILRSPYRHRICLFGSDLDACSRKVVGCAIGRQIDTQLTLAALKAAVVNASRCQGLVSTIMTVEVSMPVQNIGAPCLNMALWVLWRRWLTL